MGIPPLGLSLCASFHLVSSWVSPVFVTIVILDFSLGAKKMYSGRSPDDGVLRNNFSGLIFFCSMIKRLFI